MKTIKIKNYPTLSTLFATLCISLLSGCFTPPPAPHLGTTPEDYSREGMNPEAIESWEDGLRTNMQRGTFEWWYFDAEMDDGTKVVVVFYTKNMFQLEKSAEPQISIEITPPGEETIRKFAAYASELSTFSTEGFNVTMESNYGYGDLNTYVVHAQIEDVTVDFELNRTVPSWRPGTGIYYFGYDQKKFFAWLPSVPNGDISGTISFGGIEQQVSGSGYHDHNWGNAAMNTLFKNWWWTRGQVDEYTFISAELRTTYEYGDAKMPIFMLANNNEIIADAALPDSSMRLIESSVLAHPDPASPETIAQQVDINYQLGNDLVNVSMVVDTLLTSADLLRVSGLQSDQIDLLHNLGISPWYTRFLTDTTLSIETDTASYQGEGFSVLEKMDLE